LKFQPPVHRFDVADDPIALAQHRRLRREFFRHQPQRQAQPVFRPAPSQLPALHRQLDVHQAAGARLYSEFWIASAVTFGLNPAFDIQHAVDDPGISPSLLP